MTVLTPAKVFADRIGRIEVSATMAVAAEAAKLRAQGANLVDFGAGEPHFPTPRHIKDAAIAAIDANFTRYTVVPGIPDVRKAIVERHGCDFGSDYGIDEAIFTTGGKLALFNTMQILVDHGDEVILPVPYWVSFKDIIQYAGGKVVFLETSEAESFRITADAIEQAITPRTKAIILNSPSNPAGSVVSRRGSGADRPPGPRARDFSASGRVLRLPELCRQAGLRRLVYLGQGAHRGARLAVKDLCHDRLAGGLCAGRQAGGGQPEQAAVAIHVERDQLCAEGRHRRPGRLAGVRFTSSAPSSSTCGTTCWPSSGPFPASPAPNPKGAFYVYPNIGAYFGQRRHQDGDRAGHAAAPRGPRGHCARGGLRDGGAHPHLLSGDQGRTSTRERGGWASS